jgi:hypothetical protein
LRVANVTREQGEPTDPDDNLRGAPEPVVEVFLHSNLVAEVNKRERLCLGIRPPGTWPDTQPLRLRFGYDHLVVGRFRMVRKDEHPSEQELNLYSGDYPPEELVARIEPHLEICRKCRFTMLRMLRGSMADGAKLK